MIDQSFHGITLVDMGDTSGPDVSIADLSLLQLQWPILVVTSMSWLQPELEQLRHGCKKRYRGSQADGCTFCGKRIKLDMARHVANCHLKLAHLWRCPVSWCIIYGKGRCRIAWTTCVWCMRCQHPSEPRTWGNGSHHGQSRVRRGVTP